ncbi:MAG: 4'-phosphopantetheinyl transferase superfamily protein [Bacteroidota bacterium]
MKVLEPSESHIYLLEIDRMVSRLRHFNSYLSIDEKYRASRFRFKKDENCFLTTRGALRLLASKYVGILPKDIIFKKESFGKPKFDHVIGLDFNVSHSGNLAMIGFCLDHHLGVDVEMIKTDFDIMDIAKNYFYGREIMTLEALPSEKRHEGFFSLWTRKEAIIKYDGRGLGIPLNSFSVSLDSITPSKISKINWNSEGSEENDLYAIPTTEGYKAAFSVHRSIKKFQLFDTDYFLALKS